MRLHVFVKSHILGFTALSLKSITFISSDNYKVQENHPYIFGYIFYPLITYYFKFHM